MEKIETILTSCIKEIKSGKSTLADCLNRYPAHRRELETLLRMALNIQEPPAFNLDSNYKQSAKARLLDQIRTTKQKKSRSFSELFSFGIPTQFAWARVAVSVLVVVILLSIMGGGTAYAAQSSLPGDLLYPVKTGTENARLLVASSNSAKATLNLEFAQTRLEEMNKLVNSDEKKAGLAVNGYKGSLEAAQQQIQKISDTSTLFNILNIALVDIQNQTSFCDRVIDANPKYATQVSEASNLATNEQLALIELLAKQNNLRATQVNLNNLQNRLLRAQEKARASQYQLMQQALQQYQRYNQLGEEILQGAQNSNQDSEEIEALTLQASSSYLNTLDSISQLVPQDYQSSIETCRQVTLQFQNQARYRYQRQGNPDIGSINSSLETSASSLSGQDSKTTQGDNETPAFDGSGPTLTSPSTTGNSTESGSGTGSGSNGDYGEGNGASPTVAPSPSQGSGARTGSDGGSGSANGSSSGYSGGTAAGSGSTG